MKETYLLSVNALVILSMTATLLPIHCCIYTGQLRGYVFHPQVFCPVGVFLDARIESGSKEWPTEKSKVDLWPGLSPCCLFPYCELS